MEDHQIERGTLRVSKSYGLRKVTPGLIRAEKLTQTLKDSELPPRHAVKHAVSIFRTANILSAADAETLTTLIDFCGTWETDNNAIVFASNPRIRSRLCGVNSDRALRARLSKLGKLGLISHVERPGAKRGIEIDPFTGSKVYYGISLLPLVAALPKADQLERERETYYSTKGLLLRSISVSTTRITSLVDALLDVDQNGHFWIDAMQFAHHILKTAKTEDSIEKIRKIETQIKTLLDEVMAAADAVFAEAAELDNQLSTETVLMDQIENEESSPYPESLKPPEALSKEITDKSVHCSDHQPNRTNFTSSEFPEGSIDAHLNSHRKNITDTAGSARDVLARDLEKYGVKPNHLASISEGLHAYLPLGSETDPTWKDAAAAAFALAPIIGLTHSGWNKAVQVLGVNGATTAMAVATADVNRSRITNSSASYIVWMACQMEQGIDVGIPAKIFAAMNRMRQTVH